MTSETISAWWWKSSIFVMVSLAGLACSTSQKTSKLPEKNSEYREDATVFRPTPTHAAELLLSAFPKDQVDMTNIPDDRFKIEQALDSALQWNSRLRFIQGYRLQVYNGKDREAANKVKSQVYKTLPGIPVFTEYRQPYFKVKVGNFFERIEAQPYLVKLKAEFPTLLLVPEPIRLQDLKP